MKQEVRLSGIAYNSLVNGPGIRRVLFAQGCDHNCKGCFNPDTHDFNGGELRDCDELIESILEDPIIKGVTFSGGDPVYQADKFAYIAKRLKAENPKLNIWCYTGFTFKELVNKANTDIDIYDLLYSIDVIVDGKFVESKMTDGLKFRGSYNQNIINVRHSFIAEHIIYDGCDSEGTIVVDPIPDVLPELSSVENYTIKMSNAFLKEYLMNKKSEHLRKANLQEIANEMRAFALMDIPIAYTIQQSVDSNKE